MGSTVVSWALTLSLVGVGVYYYRPDLVKSLTSQPQPASVPQTESSAKPLNKKPKQKKNQVHNVKVDIPDSTPADSNETVSNKKRKIAEPSSVGATKPQTGTVSHDDVDSGDREFAQQLARAQAGTDLQKREQQRNKTKTKKTSKKIENDTLERSGFSTETSSTAGRDADDDLTPADSPPTKATAGPSRAGDISDMLETPAAKPMSIRLTGVPESSTNKKKPAARAFEPVLTKKQRQAQAKKEELRQMREESDRVHEAKKQEQLRRARIAEGTSNQTKANNFTSTANAWQSGKNNASVKAPPPSTAAPLLDTFEPSQNNISQPNGAIHVTNLAEVQPDDAVALRQDVGRDAAAALTASAREGPSAWTANISEEAQIQLLKEQHAEDAWESVTSKKSKKKSKHEGDSGNEAPVVVQNEAPTAHRTNTHPHTAGASNLLNRSESHANNRFTSIQTPSSTGLADAEWEA